MNKQVRIPFAAVLLASSVLLAILQMTPMSKSLFGFVRLVTLMSVLPILVDLVLCYALFAKQRNTIVVLAIAGNVILLLIGVVKSLPAIPSISSVLGLLAYVLLLMFALALCEQTAIKTDLSKLKIFASKRYYLPALLLLINCSLYTFRLVNNGVSLEYIVVNTIDSLLNCIIVFSLAKWLVSPEVKERGGIANKLGVKSGLVIAIVVALLLALIGSGSLKPDKDTGNLKQGICSHCHGSGKSEFGNTCGWCDGYGFWSIYE